MAGKALNAAQVQAMLIAIADRLIASEPLLSEADRQLGDGDHGLGMARGASAMNASLAAATHFTIPQLFATAGMAMLSSMGGASGPLFGTFFRAGGKALEGRQSFNSQALADFLDAAHTAVAARGGAKPGDKTMIDALAPAAVTARQLVNLPLAEVLIQITARAAEGKEATKGLPATVGRAKALGQAAIGHADPGAISVCLILEAMRDYVMAFV